MTEQNIIINLNANDNASKKIKEVEENLSGLSKVANVVVNPFKKLTTPLVSLTSKLGNFSTKLFQNFIGLLFFSQQLSRSLNKLIFSTISFFREITNGQTESGAALTRLQASWQLLRFTIGDAIATALQPFIGTIVDIIKNISDWIEKNPRIIAAILLLSAAFATLLTFGLSLSFAITGIIGLFELLLTPIGLILIALVALGIAWETNFLGIRDKIASFVTWFIRNVWNNGFNYVFGALIKILETVYFKFKQRFLDMLDISKVVWEGIKLIIGGTINGLLGFFENFINSFVFVINKTIDSYNFLARKSKGLLPEIEESLDDVSFDKFELSIDGLVDSTISAYDNITKRSQETSEKINDIWTNGWDKFGKVSEENIQNIGNKVKDFSIIDTIKNSIIDAQNILEGTSLGQTTNQQNVINNQEITYSILIENPNATPQELFDIMQEEIERRSGPQTTFQI